MRWLFIAIYLNEMRLGMLTIFDGTPPMVILRTGGVDMLTLSRLCAHNHDNNKRFSSYLRPSNIEYCLYRYVACSWWWLEELRALNCTQFFTVSWLSLLAGHLASNALVINYGYLHTVITYARVIMHSEMCIIHSILAAVSTVQIYKD